MTDFKLGDKIKLAVSVGPCKHAYTFGVEIGDTLTVVNNRDPAPGFFLGNGEVYINWANEHKDYFEVTKEFDLKKDRWFIRTPTKEISDAVVVWLSENDLKLHSFFKSDEHLKTYGDQACLSGDGEQTEIGVCYSSYSFYKLENRKEIKLTFKTVVDSVEYPIVETEQEIKIRELKETIEKAQKQIDEIINNKN